MPDGYTLDSYLRKLAEEGLRKRYGEPDAEALERLKARRFQVLVSDQRMPQMTGVELLREVKEISPNSVRMLLTGYSDLAAIVGSINEGEVYRFVKKPWDNAEMQKTVADAVAIGANWAPSGDSPKESTLA